MKLSASQRGPGTMSPSMAKESQYSYGLQIRLEKADLEKLGIKRLPAAGDYFEITASCCVTRVYEAEGIGEEPDRAITLQIEKMKVD
jgi:hypothetical protein